MWEFFKLFAQKLVFLHDGSHTPWLKMDDSSPVSCEAPAKRKHRVKGKEVDPSMLGFTAVPRGHYESWGLTILRVGWFTGSKSAFCWDNKYRIQTHDTMYHNLTIYCLQYSISQFIPNWSMYICF